MKEIPMLFSTPMVQAILEGRKSQTRRLLKVKHLPANDIASVHRDGSGKGWIAWAGRAVSAEETKTVYPGEQGFKCSYGKPGDILWVRETYMIEGSMSHGESVLGVKYKAGGRWIQNNSKEVFEIFHKSKEGWRPNIFLPKTAARIWLQVTDVRVERLQDISEQDAIAEGVNHKWCKSLKECLYDGCASSCAHADLYENYMAPGFADYLVSGAKQSFRSLWQSINGLESWDANPFVWVISFKVLSITGKPDEVES